MVFFSFVNPITIVLGLTNKLFDSKYLILWYSVLRFLKGFYNTLNIFSISVFLEFSIFVKYGSILYFNCDIILEENNYIITSIISCIKELVTLGLEFNLVINFNALFITKSSEVSFKISSSFFLFILKHPTLVLIHGNKMLLMEYYSNGYYLY